MFKGQTLAASDIWAVHHISLKTIKSEEHTPLLLFIPQDAKHLWDSFLPSFLVGEGQAIILVLMTSYWVAIFMEK